MGSVATRGVVRDVALRDERLVSFGVEEEVDVPRAAAVVTGHDGAQLVRAVKAGAENAAQSEQPLNTKRSMKITNR